MGHGVRYYAEVVRCEHKHVRLVLRGGLSSFRSSLITLEQAKLGYRNADLAEFGSHVPQSAVTGGSDMIEEKEPPKVGRPPEPLKSGQELEKAEASPPIVVPEPMQHSVPGRKPLFRH